MTMIGDAPSLVHTHPKNDGDLKISNKNSRVASLSPIHFRKQAATDGMDLNIGVQSLAFRAKSTTLFKGLDLFFC